MVEYESARRNVQDARESPQDRQEGSSERNRGRWSGVRLKRRLRQSEEYQGGFMMDEQVVRDLFKRQKELDETIYTAHKIKVNKAKMLRDKIRAFRNEVGELEGENEYFKYWKHNKGKGNEPEEYVDGLFFLLSIGVLQGYRPLGLYAHTLGSMDLGQQFDEVHLYTGIYLMDTSYTKWVFLCRVYLGIAEILGYDEAFILEEYNKKYIKNLNRVKVGY
jgi:dimeric dUTPase (all-alpha-NTP-PPase superfamily)